jgi:ribosomal protein L37E
MGEGAGVKDVTFLLVTIDRHPGIHCLVCGRVSFNRSDIEQRYCGYCKRFHEEPQPKKES